MRMKKHGNAYILANYIQLMACDGNTKLEFDMSN